jgi:hypothetical protein
MQTFSVYKNSYGDLVVSAATEKIKLYEGDINIIPLQFLGKFEADCSCDFTVGMMNFIEKYGRKDSKEYQHYLDIFSMGV